MKLRIACVVLVALSAVASCTGGGDSEAEAEPLAVDTAGASFQFEVRSVEPIQEGANDLRVAVLHADGTPITDCTLEVTATMPSMAHATASATAIDHTGEGAFDVNDLTFTMPGTWEITLSATSGTVVDRVRVEVEVP